VPARSQLAYSEYPVQTKRALNRFQGFQRFERFERKTRCDFEL
jgi:hypothetical protein